MKRTDIQDVVNKFMKDATPNHRYASFDYCFNYFKNTSDLSSDIEKSCLVLGFYLASWGMYRGSSFLLRETSIKHLEKLIIYYSSLNKSFWEIDVDKYSQQNINNILEVYNKTKENILLDKSTAHLTLVTKILLGVFGFLPAFDRFFCNSFRKIFEEKKCGFTTVNEKSLQLISEFYLENKEDIDKISNETFTYDFLSENKTKTNYPKAKVIDMFGFQLELSNSTT